MVTRWGSNSLVLKETVALSLHHLYFTICSCLRSAHYALWIAYRRRMESPWLPVRSGPRPQAFLSFLDRLLGTVFKHYLKQMEHVYVIHIRSTRTCLNSVRS